LQKKIGTSSCRDGLAKKFSSLGSKIFADSIEIRWKTWSISSWCDERLTGSEVRIRKPSSNCFESIFFSFLTGSSYFKASNLWMAMRLVLKLIGCSSIRMNWWRPVALIQFKRCSKNCADAGFHTNYKKSSQDEKFWPLELLKDILGFNSELQSSKQKLAFDAKKWESRWPLFRSWDWWVWCWTKTNEMKRKTLQSYSCWKTWGCFKYLHKQQQRHKHTLKEIWASYFWGSLVGWDSFSVRCRNSCYLHEKCVCYYELHFLKVPYFLLLHQKPQKIKKSVLILDLG